MRFLSTLFMSLSALVLAQAPIALLPADNAVNGWMRAGAVGYCFTGSAANSQSLYGIIDGGAEVYLSRAYAGSAYDGYVKGPDTVCVEIYDQGNADSAKSVYDYYVFGEYEILSGLGDRAKLDTSPAFGNKIEMTSGRYFVRLYIQSKDRLLVEEGRKIIQAIVSNAIAVEKKGAHPVKQVAISHYPDPLRHGCRIEITLPGPQEATCEILDCRGVLVSRIALFAGNNRYSGYWDAKDLKGGAVSAGVYFASVRTGNSRTKTKIVLSR